MTKSTNSNEYGLVKKSILAFLQVSLSSKVQSKFIDADLSFNILGTVYQLDSMKSNDTWHDLVNYKEFKNIRPKHCFLFAWNHYKEIFKKEKNNKIKWFCHIDKKHFPKNLRKNFI